MFSRTIYVKADNSLYHVVDYRFQTYIVFIYYFLFRVRMLVKIVQILRVSLNLFLPTADPFRYRGSGISSYFVRIRFVLIRSRFT